MPNERTSSTDELTFIQHAMQAPESFSSLYSEYQIDVYRYCYRRLENREAAEDATSIVFSRALGSLGSFRGESFRSWLFAIAHNVVVDTYRRRGVSRKNGDALLSVDASLTPEEIALGRERRQTIHTLLDRLTPAQRDVVELRLAGLTGAEIARVLERSHGSVRALQHRAFLRIRELIATDQKAAELRP